MNNFLMNCISAAPVVIGSYYIFFAGKKPSNTTSISESEEHMYHDSNDSSFDVATRATDSTFISTDHSYDFSHHSSNDVEHISHDVVVNTNGLPMVGGYSGVDVGGHTWGDQ